MTTTARELYMELTIKEIKSLMKQQVYNAQAMLFMLCFSVLKNESTWAYFDLDYIIGQGDNLMKCLGVRKTLAVDELPLSVKLKGCDLEVTMLQHYSNRFSKFDLFIDHKELSSTEVGNGAIFTCAGISFALIWGRKSVFLFDSHSRNSEGCMTQMVYQFS